MTALLAIGSIILIVVILIQIGRVSELASKIRGEEESRNRNNQRNAYGLMAFMIVFLVGTVVSAFYYRNWMLGYGPLEAASEHGSVLDELINTTLLVTGVVFIITHIVLFYFAFKYREQKGRKVIFIPHDNRVEVVWTIVPAVVMCFLVVQGIVAWNTVMADVGPEEAVGTDYIEIEATGYQFAWDIRYPGADEILGEKNFRLIDPGNNPLGQDWLDPNGLDDFYPSEIVLPKGQKVRVRITARDVLHDFYLPHFSVKMDAIPGLPTYFVFTPKYTTEEYRAILGARNDDGTPVYPEYWELRDPEDPKSELWRTFNYELACAELCGKGHYSMRRLVKIVEPADYERWKRDQDSYYMSTVRGKEFDPLLGQVLDSEVRERRLVFNDAVEKALQAEDANEKIVQLDYVTFETGSANLTDISRYELTNLIDVLNKYPNMRIELRGHTDNTGNPDSNLTLSDARADAVFNYVVDKGISTERLTSNGYGSTQPIETNDTEEGRAENRRVEFQIVEQ